MNINNFSGVVVGGSNSVERKKCLQQVLSHKESLSGIAVQGITESGSNTMHVTTDQVESIFEEIGVSLNFIYLCSVIKDILNNLLTVVFFLINIFRTKYFFLQILHKIIHSLVVINND